MTRSRCQEKAWPHRTYEENVKDAGTPGQSRDLRFGGVGAATGLLPQRCDDEMLHTETGARGSASSYEKARVDRQDMRLAMLHFFRNVFTCAHAAVETPCSCARYVATPVETKVAMPAPVSRGGHCKITKYFSARGGDGGVPSHMKARTKGCTCHSTFEGESPSTQQNPNCRFRRERQLPLWGSKRTRIITWGSDQRIWDAKIRSHRV